MSTMREVTSFTQTRKVWYLPLRDITMTPYQNRINYIDALIQQKGIRTSEYWTLDFNQLTSEEQGNLIALKIEEDDYDAYDCFHENTELPKDDKITYAFFKMLRINSPQNRDEFCNVIRNQSKKIFEKSIQYEIDNRCNCLRNYFIQIKGYSE